MKYLIVALCLICSTSWASGNNFIWNWPSNEMKEECQKTCPHYWQGFYAGRKEAFAIAKQDGYKPKSILEGKTRLDGGQGKKRGEIYYEIRYLESNDKGEVESMILKNASISKFKVTRGGSKLVSSEKAEIKIKIYK